MDDVHCGLYLLMFESGSITASVNIPIMVNDDVPECDETFTADIILEEGFLLGLHPSTSITIIDEGMMIKFWSCIVLLSYSHVWA